MDEFDSGVIQLELKYCERCGGLWRRPRGSDLVFCAPCALVLSGLRTSFQATLPPRRRFRRGPQRPDGILE
jgi:hypothetical protein